MGNDENDPDGPASEEPSVVSGNFGGEPYRELNDLEEALFAVIWKFEGVPTMGVVGVLELIKHKLIAPT